LSLILTHGFGGAMTKGNYPQQHWMQALCEGCFTRELNQVAQGLLVEIQIL